MSSAPLLPADHARRLGVHLAGFYSQHGEDAVLARAFAGQPTGHWIDVGASHPTTDSVTRWFYDRGWVGVNLEPQPSAFAALCAERPRDINLQVAVGNIPGPHTLVMYPAAPSLSTLDPRMAAHHAGNGLAAAEVPVEVVRLDDIFDSYFPEQRVDFLKIDAEGSELSVLQSVSLARWRPRVVLVEWNCCGALDTHAEWEPLVFAAGYRFVLDDGLNRFYAHPDLGWVEEP